MRNTTLFTAHLDGVTLAEALAHVPGGLALISTPRKHVFTTAAAARDAVPPKAFEARVFAESAELRWLNMTDDGHGRAVLLTEDESIIGADFTRDETWPDIRARPSRYLLWGRTPSTGSSDPRPGWSTLHAERIGALTVPIDLPPDARAEFTTEEYVAVDEVGNAYVLDERLLSLAPAEARTIGNTT